VTGDASLCGQASAGPRCAEAVHAPISGPPERMPKLEPAPDLPATGANALGHTSARHVARMRERHPAWSERRLRCCLYWQGRARAALRREVQVAMQASPGSRAVYCPEACGVNVTATMASIGIELEWPPVTLAYQVALVGMAREKP
jgi:hypothetical protein